jgi:hypothetical protein
MRCMVFVKATNDSENGVIPSTELLAAMGHYNEELLKAGIMLGCGGLRPTSQAKRVRFSGDKRTVIDGPFAPTQEQIAGYWLWEVKSINEAVEWLKRCPNPMLVDSEIEIRPEFEAADFTQ